MFSNTQQVASDKQQAKPVYFQPKLSINEPGDVYEQQADHMAAVVMQAADNPVNKTPFFKPVNNTLNNGFIQKSESDHEVNQESLESPSSEFSLFASEATCLYYKSKFWLDDKEKDEQLFDRVVNHFSDQPDAKKHLLWYKNGDGADYKEDVYELFHYNPGVQARVAKQIGQTISATNKKGQLIGNTDKNAPIKQEDYDVDNWRNANGNIDEVDWELIGEYTPHGANTFKLGIKDPYTWHPLEARSTQCLHEAMVRLQKFGAKDYTTIGEDNYTLIIP